MNPVRLTNEVLGRIGGARSCGHDLWDLADRIGVDIRTLSEEVRRLESLGQCRAVKTPQHSVCHVIFKDRGCL